MLRSLQRLDFNAQIRVLIDLRSGGIQRPDENSPRPIPRRGLLNTGQVRSANVFY